MEFSTLEGTPVEAPDKLREAPKGRTGGRREQYAPSLPETEAKSTHSDTGATMLLPGVTPDFAESSILFDFWMSMFTSGSEALPKHFVWNQSGMPAHHTFLSGAMHVLDAKRVPIIACSEAECFCGSAASLHHVLLAIVVIFMLAMWKVVQV